MEEWVTLMKVVGEDPEDKRVDAVFMCTDQGGGVEIRGQPRWRSALGSPLFFTAVCARLAGPEESYHSPVPVTFLGTDDGSCAAASGFLKRPS